MEIDRASCDALLQLPFRSQKSPILDNVALLCLRSGFLQKLELVDVSAKPDFWHALAESIKANRNCIITELDISKNAIDDKGAIALSIAFGCLKLTSVGMAEVGMTGKGVSAVCHALAESYDSLVDLDLKGNKLGPVRPYPHLPQPSAAALVLTPPHTHTPSPADQSHRRLTGALCVITRTESNRSPIFSFQTTC